MEFNFMTCAAPADNTFGKTVSKYAEPVKTFYESGDEHQCMTCADADEAKRIYKGLYSYVHGNNCEYKDKVSTCRRDNVIYLNRI